VVPHVTSITVSKMPVTPSELVLRARALADDLLFPAALATDRAPVIPVGLLDALADAGLYGLLGHPDSGGQGADPTTAGLVMEAIASGCLTTAFVLIQHHKAAFVASTSSSSALRDQFAADLCAGRCRAGVAFAHLRRPGPPAVVGRLTDDGWVLDGVAPWVTGWGRIDVVNTAVRCGDDVVWLLIDAVESPTATAHRLDLAVLNASATVELEFRAHVVPVERMTERVDFETWAAADAMGLRLNGSLALGVAHRAARLLGSDAAIARVDRCREQLDDAELDGGVDTMGRARAAACLAALDLTAALVASTGGRAVILDHHGQRLAREAMFLLVQGQTPAIRAAQREGLLG
jgi:alkylation response protein AidB-like acyl-CoA dehydrogenase